MSNWRDNLRTASFRGVEFLTDSAEIERGRRLVVHEYPLRDEPDIEDLGRKTRRYPLDIYLLASSLGDDYWPERDRLAQALDADGAGTLIHPYYGSIRVHVEQAGESYSTREGGMVRWSVTFVASAEPAETFARIDTAQALIDSADALEEEQARRFEERMTIKGVAEFVRDGVRTGLDSMHKILGLPGEFSQDINDITSVVTALQAARASLSTIGFGGLRKVWEFGDDEPAITGTTPTALIQAQNQAAMIDLTRGIGLVAAADAIAATDFASVDNAIAARDELIAQLDRAELTADTAEYDALVAMRAALVTDINTRGAQLERITRITLATTQPALVLAHRLYGDATRDAEIVARNRRVIRHPGFVPGGVELEVLSG